MLAAGNVLQGRYKVLEPLNEGGMSIVYLATDSILGNRVAVKEMKDHFLNPQERALAAKQFLAEAQILAQLEHAGLPRVTNFFEQDGKHYLVMDFIKGETVENVALRSGGAMPEEMVLRVSAEVCRVLDYLHHCEPAVIFRDLKPSNIMLTDDGRVKLIDFGISKSFDTNTGTRTIIKGAGTPGFAPPEQYGASNKNRTDARSDIYALGATMYALLTGETPAEATDRWMNGVPLVPPSEIKAGITPEVEALILRMMELKPDSRPSSAAEVLDALHQAHPDLIATAGGPSTVGRLETTTTTRHGDGPPTVGGTHSNKPVRRLHSSVAGSPLGEGTAEPLEEATPGIYPFAGSAAPSATGGGNGGGPATLTPQPPVAAPTVPSRPAATPTPPAATAPPPMSPPPVAGDGGSTVTPSAPARPPVSPAAPAPPTPATVAPASTAVYTPAPSTSPPTQVPVRPASGGPPVTGIVAALAVALCAVLAFFHFRGGAGQVTPSPTVSPTQMALPSSTVSATPSAAASPSAVASASPSAVASSTPAVAFGPNYGGLSLAVDPPDAVLKLDGQVLPPGQTPLVQYKLSAREHTLDVKRDGYLPQTIKFTIEEGRVNEQGTVHLQPAAELIVTSTPHAKLSVDQKMVGTTPCTVRNLKPGKHAYALEAAGYEAARGFISLEAGEHHKFDKSLQRIVVRPIETPHPIVHHTSAPPPWHPPTHYGGGHSGGGHSGGGHHGGGGEVMATPR